MKTKKKWVIGLVVLALETEDPAKVRENLLALYVWAPDILDTVQCTDSYVSFYQPAYRDQRNQAWALQPELHGERYMKDGFSRF